MKKTIAILLAVVMLLSLTACGRNGVLPFINNTEKERNYSNFFSVPGENETSTVPIKAENGKLSASDIREGSVILLGYYEQDNDLNNGKEPIEWIVIKTNYDRALIISKYVLDYMQSAPKVGETQWEDSLIREWLNGTFYYDAFSIEEQAMILETRVQPDKNPKGDMNEGEATNDYVFLLSIAEAESGFFGYNKDNRICSPTAYAVAKGVFTTYRGNTGWLLRTRGFRYGGRIEYVSYVDGVGEIDYNGCEGDKPQEVRPAMWISITP